MKSHLTNIVKYLKNYEYIFMASNEFWRNLEMILEREFFAVKEECNL